jgi:Flp pilus assembly pilin Flp
MKFDVRKIRSSKRRHETGATMVEYVFIIIFVAMVALIGIKTFGQTVNNQMGSNNNSVSKAMQ